MTKLCIRNLEKSLEKSAVLKDLSLDINLDPPTIYGFVGPNGAGKTTTMKVISSLYLPNKGKIIIENSSLSYSKWAKENISYIPAGDRGLFYKISVFDNAMYYGIIKGTNPQKIKANIKIFAEKLKMTNLLNRRIEQLSTGQKKKAQLLCSLCSEKKLLLLDEPSLGLDVDSSVDLQITLAEVFESLKISIFISSHDVNFLSKVASRYYFIFDGTIKGKYTSFYNPEQIEEKYYELKSEYK